MACIPVLQFIIWICVGFMADMTQALHATACYNLTSGCNTYNLTCTGTDERIRITGSVYRYKHNTTGTTSSGGCCPLDENDCKANYSYQHALLLYSKCSGKNICLTNQAPTPTAFECQPYNVDKYIHVNYMCISGSNIYDLCNTTERESEQMNIIFDHSFIPNRTTAQCSCSIKANAPVTYELVDIRVLTNVHGDAKYDCFSGTFKVNENRISCSYTENKGFVYMDSRDFQGEIQKTNNFKEVLQLTYTGGAIPDMIWVKLTAARNKNFTIRCASDLLKPSTETPMTEHGSTSTVKADDSSSMAASNLATWTSSYGTTSFNNLTSSQIIVTTIVPNGADESEAQRGKSEDWNSFPTIIGVVIAVIIVIAIVVVAIILFKRQQKKRKEENTHISDLPKELTNHIYESSTKAGDSNAAVEISNYDIIHDELVLTYSLPGKTKEDTTCKPERSKKYGAVSADEYDRIEFKKEGAIKSSNYDTLPAMEGKIRDDTYQHVSNQSKTVTTGKDTTNEYSHYKLSSKDAVRNDDEYSHVDLKEECTKSQEPNTNEEDSYNHIDFDETQHPKKNVTAVISKNESESEKNSPTCIDIKSRDIKSKNFPLNNGATGLSSKDVKQQGIKAVPLMNNYNGLAPRTKDQQHTAVVKVNIVKHPNGTEDVTKENKDSKNPNLLFSTPINSDYEFAKPIDL